ncbi:ABC transporter substrate-binding protein [Halomonas cerina]|uniref:Putative hydroxymethylpyrimidine transport system substrate-binding protein n=1 Tax=Halomonas cerina TaxID=447424 RepID=A0A839V161_9GAMM|nr:ABC transporter substrate-binding protein [Halomonas cerina]MBB3189072.1 putative hydroxymethylpyrimidine transport system substrate-binding protein [Halomonas cerina]
MIPHARRRLIRDAISLMLLGSLPFAGLIAAQDSTAPLLSLDSEVRVLDLSRPSDTSWERFAGLPSGPAVDTPSRPLAPAMALRPADPIAPPPVTDLEVMLDWYPSLHHAALLIAQERKLFARRGLSVTLSTPADPEVPTKLLAAARVELAVTRQPLLHLQVEQGMPLIRVATLVGLPLATLVLKEHRAPDALTGLAGRRIGHSDRDGEQVLLAALLARHEVTREEVDSPNVHFGLEQAMALERVDGVIGAMRHLLPRQLADEGMAVRTYPVEEHGVPLHDGLILVANRDRLAQHRDGIQRFVAAVEEATAWILNHPDEAWTLLVTTQPTLDTRANRAAWPEIRARLSLRPAAVDQARYANFETFLFEAGIIKTRTPWERLAMDPGLP